MGKKEKISGILLGTKIGISIVDTKLELYQRDNPILQGYKPRKRRGKNETPFPQEETNFFTQPSQY